MEELHTVTLSNLAMHQFYVMLNDFRPNNTKDLIPLKSLYDALHFPVTQFEQMWRWLIDAGKGIEGKINNPAFTPEEKEKFALELQSNDVSVGALHEARFEIPLGHSEVVMMNNIVRKFVTSGKIAGMLSVGAAAELLGETEKYVPDELQEGEVDNTQ